MSNTRFGKILKTKFESGKPECEMKNESAILEGITDFGAHVEELDLTVIPQDREAFDNALNTYLSKADPELNIKDAVNQLDGTDQRQLVIDLQEFHYSEDDE